MDINTDIWKDKFLKLPGLEAQLKMSPVLRDEDIKGFGDMSNSFKSAVLVIIFLKNNKLNLLLTKRSAKLKKHRGQISFPGGKMDDIDDNLLQTALREAKEEVGFDTNSEIIGSLTPLLIPITSFHVHQYVTYCEKLPQLKINPDEVEELIEVPISEFMKTENLKSKQFGITNSGRKIIAPYYDINGIEVWGATAMMISELTELLFSDMKN